jgi:RHS repeat-associated protein
MVVEWPAAYLWMSHLSRENTPAGPRSWTGSLIQNKRDLTGLLYMRNRYYDPKTGRFTQEDPIGLAGGLNAYGFADGDPVGYSDPYGLSAEASCCRDNPSPRNLALEVRTFQWNAEHPKESLMLAGVGLAAVAIGTGTLAGAATLESGVAINSLAKASEGAVLRVGRGAGGRLQPRLPNGRFAPRDANSISNVASRFKANFNTTEFTTEFAATMLRDGVVPGYDPRIFTWNRRGAAWKEKTHVASSWAAVRWVVSKQPSVREPSNPRHG